MTETQPRTADQIAAIEALCRACAQWDAQAPGCRLFRSCERKALTRSIWRLGHCSHRDRPRW